MEIVKKYGYEELAILYIGEIENKYLEFIESIQPPHSREEKWVLIISTMYGCPVKCSICDAGKYFKGNLSTHDIFNQIDYMVLNRYPEKKISIPKFKIQFARMGEPTLNPNVLEVLKQLPYRYDAPGLIPCISTIAPRKAKEFMAELMEIKHIIYSKYQFQMQFSLHTTDEKLRDQIIPYPKWSLKEIAEYGEDFIIGKDRKITLNFAANKYNPIDKDVISELFNPKKFIIKLTPLNPTRSVIENQFQSFVNLNDLKYVKQIIDSLKDIGFETILSIGELEENLIGSNCGLHALKFENDGYVIRDFLHFRSNTTLKSDSYN
ncbi:MAG: radical SAM protein [Candidatus Lokiarchaeota archaeon]|nr:radical SAM protein [Candidatus Lokiarchaeota archaeon]